jgi:stearoyl-CoA desaturase (delta-9 desaturase)
MRRGSWLPSSGLGPKESVRMHNMEVALDGGAGRLASMPEIAVRSVGVAEAPDLAAIEHDPRDPQVAAGRSRAEHKLRVINVAAVVLPFAGLIAAMVLSWGVAFNWVHLAVMVGVGLVSSFGITVGFHRLCTHRSFKTPTWLRYAFAAAGSMAVQGPVIWWCGEHRRHHQHSDTEGDPHSPHMNENGSWGEGIKATLRGGFHAHIGWMLNPRAESRRGLGKYTRDLRQDPALVAADKQFGMWVLIGLIVPAVLGGLLTWSWFGVLMGFLWGGLVRILVVHHITWSVNSICHLWGAQPFVSHDESRNNPIVGILALGEGWHNGHHAFPTSARHGLRWWELDLSYWFIRALGVVGLAKEIKVPDAERIASKLTRRDPAGVVAPPAVSVASPASAKVG